MRPAPGENTDPAAAFPDAPPPLPSFCETAPDDDARWEVAEGTAWVCSSGNPARTLVARPPLQGPLELTGPAHDLWIAWAEGMTFAQSVARMQLRYDGDPARIRADAWTLARQLVEAGMLRRGGR